MKAILLLVCVICGQGMYAQAKLKFDSTAINFGYIIEETYFFENIWFTNIGNEPLIIVRASTGDGGSYAEWPKEPIAAGKRAAIRFRYDTKRIGKLNRSIYVTSNANNITISIKGEVIRKVTTVAIDEKIIDLGTIPFGTIASAKFTLTNTGSETLYLNFSTYNYKHQDIFYVEFSESTVKQNYNHSYEPGENAVLTFAFRNIYGNSGDFEREIPISFNSLDTIFVKIKGIYSGKPCQNKIYERYRILNYENNKLMSIEELNGYGKPERVHYFLNSDFIKTEK